MATNDQKFPIDLGIGGIDTKTDSKQVLPTNFTTLKNRVFTKIKQLKKVFGFNQLTTTVSDGTTFPAITNLGNYHDELLGLSASKLYALSEAENKWLPKGNLTSLQPNSKNVVKNSYQQSQMDIAITGNYICYVWLDSRGGLRAQVEDNVTGSILLADTDIGASLTAAKCPRLIALSSTVFGIFYNEGTAIRRINLTVPTMVFAAAANVVTGLDALTNAFDIVAGASFHALAYTIASGPSIQIAKVNSSGAVTSSVNRATSTTPQSVNCTIDPSNNQIFVGFVSFVNGNQSEYWCFGYDSTLSALFVPTRLHGAAYFPGYGNLYPSMTGIITSTNVITYYFDVLQTYFIQGVGLPTGVLSAVFQASITSTGTFFSVSRFHNHAALASRAFQVSSNFYVNLVTPSVAQSTLFTVRSDQYVMAKMLPSEAGDVTWASGTLPNVISTASNIYAFVAQMKTAIISSAANTSFSLYGLTKETLDFTQTYPVQSVLVNDQLLLTGGVTTLYDGTQTYEHGFHVYPEVISLNATSILATPVVNVIPQQFLLSVSVDGDVSHAQAFTVTASSADYIFANQYFKFFNKSDANNYAVYFVKDGVGSGPGAGTDIAVSIEGNFTAQQVANAIYQTLSQLIPLTILNVSMTYDGNKTLTFLNTQVGTCTRATNHDVGVAAIASGTYQYCAVYEWRDGQGNLHRSAPSIVDRSTTIANGSNKAIYAQINTLTLTEKTTNKTVPRPNVTISLYRTTASGTIFYRVSSIIQPTENLTFDNGLTYDFGSWVTILDIFSDAQIISNEILYTNGGVLENISPPATTAIFKNRDRIWVSSPEQKTVWYSKRIVKGTAVSFSDLLTIVPDASGEDVIAINEMDDKIILFKENYPLYLVGDGPNDTGQGGSFSLPQPIVAPAGVIDSNSVVKVPTGLVYFSSRGFYFLNRSLQSSYIGAPVESFNSFSCLASTILEDLSQIRFLMSSNDFLIYDYDQDKWSQRHVSGTLTDALLWKGNYTVSKSNAVVWTEDPTASQDNNTNIQTVAETGWIHVGGVVGFQRVKTATIIGDYISPHVITVSVGYDYDTSYQSNDIYTYTPAAVQPLQFLIHLRKQKCQAIRFKITDSGVAGGGYTEGNTLTNLTLLLGLKKGTAKLPSSQRS